MEETRSFRAEAMDYAGQTSTAETSIIIKPSQTGPIVSVGDNAQVIDIQGDIAVTGGSNGMLNIYNIGVPTSPVLLGSLNINRAILQVRIEGNRVYAVDNYYMRVIDITNPANPVELSATNTAYSYSIDVFDDIVFLGRYAGYISVYDVWDGQSPVRKSTRDLGNGNVRDLKIDGMTGMLYAVVDNGANSYLSVLDAIDVNNLVEIGRVPVPGTPRGIEVAGDNAYIAVGDGMVIVSLVRLGTVDFGTDGDSDGMADDILSYIPTLGDAYDVEINGDYAYIADGLYNGVKVIDITDAWAPYEVAEIDTFSDILDIVISGSYAYAADGYAGLSVIRLFTAEIIP